MVNLYARWGETMASHRSISESLISPYSGITFSKLSKLYYIDGLRLRSSMVDRGSSDILDDGRVYKTFSSSGIYHFPTQFQMYQNLSHAIFGQVQPLMISWYSGAVIDFVHSFYIDRAMYGLTFQSFRYVTEADDIVALTRSESAVLVVWIHHIKQRDLSEQITPPLDQRLYKSKSMLKSINPRRIFSI